MKSPSANEDPARFGQSQKRVTVAVSQEPNFLATKFEAGSTSRGAEFHFLSNSALAVRDSTGVARPLLAAALPSQADGSWVVNFDGSMAVTWRIRDNALGHDRQPVSPEDFVFALRVYTDEQMAVRDREPERYISRIEALDDRRFVIHWKTSYPWANELVSRQLEPLPAHLMHSVYQAQRPEAFVVHSFWSSPSYVGAGPYVLDRWERGTELAFKAFDAFFLGRAKIDEIIFKIVPDPNTIVATLLAGGADVSLGSTLEPNLAATIQERWRETGEGQVIIEPARFRHIKMQQHPERTGQPALLDVRVRRALAHGIDRQALADAMTLGVSGVAHVPVMETYRQFAAVDAAISKYPYSASSASRLLQEAGWKLQGQQLTDVEGQPFNLDIRATTAADSLAEMAIIANDLGKLGLQVSQDVVSQARGDLESNVMFPGLSPSARSLDVPGTLIIMTSGQCPTAERRYIGSNGGCWRNAEFDRFFTIATSSLGATERDDAYIGAVKILTDDVGVIGLYYRSEYLPVRKGLTGVGPRWPGIPGNTWNVHEWDRP